MGYHVPRNDALARVKPEDGDAPGEWTRYQDEWTRANHVRALAALAGAAALTVALLVD